MNLHFGDCVLDVEARRLLRAGAPVHLSPKAFDLLRVLIESRPRAVAKSELLDRVWPGTFVSDASLARAVNELRRAVGDGARHPKMVRTVHGFGYAFAGVVTSTVATAHPASGCRLLAGTEEFPLPAGAHVIGRDAQADIKLESATVSRQHARVVADATGATLEDLESKNGTFVNGERADGAVLLAPGDVIQIGSFTLVFHAGTPADSTRTAAVRRGGAPRRSR